MHSSVTLRLIYKPGPPDAPCWWVQSRRRNKSTPWITVAKFHTESGAREAFPDAIDRNQHAIQTIREIAANIR